MPLHVPDNTPRGTHDCRLEYISAGVIRLMPFGGNQLMIGGVRYSIPSGGVSMAPPGGSSSTPFYIYAYCADGVWGLTYSTDGPTVDPHGMPANLTSAGWGPNVLVGLIMGGSTFKHGGNSAGVISYWNRKRFAITNSVRATSGVATAATAMSDLGVYVYWMSFANDIVRLMVDGTIYGDSTMAAVPQLGIDSVLVGQLGYSVIVTATALNSLSLHYDAGPMAAGYHYGMLYGSVGSGTMTVYPVMSAMVEA